MHHIVLYQYLKILDEDNNVEAHILGGECWNPMLWSA